MAENRRYYWLKLNEDFFEDHTIEWIEEQENGEKYVLFYLKLCLKSLKDDGKLIRYVGDKLIPYDVKTLSKLTNTDSDTVAVAMKAFESIGIVEILGTGEVYLKQIDEMIGSETSFAIQKRKQRAKNKVLELTDGQCPDNVNECPPEKEKEKEKRVKDKDKDKESEQQNNNKILSKAFKQQIIDRWNSIGEPVKPIRQLTDKRIKAIKALQEQSSDEDILLAIDKLKESRYCKGKNESGWVVSFDFLLRKDKFNDILEDRYHNDRYGWLFEKLKNKQSEKKDGNQQYSGEEYENFIANWKPGDGLWEEYLAQKGADNG